MWEFQRDQAVYEILPIPAEIWNWWPWCKCRVRGREVKVTDTGEMAVCHVRVNICEVDPLIFVIRRLPDLIIRRLRDELFIALEKAPIPPQPEPDPLAQGDDPGFL